MFQWISIIGICGAVGLAGLHALVFPCGCGSRLSPIGLIRRMTHLLTLLFLEQHLTWVGRIRKLVYLLTMLSVLVLAATAFGPVVLGLRMVGWLLMIHATFAGVFAFCMAFLAITWAQAFAFQKETGLCCCPVESIVRKAGFWILIGLSLPISLTMVLSMFPIFGTHGQETLLQIHRYCTLAFVIVGILQTYFVIRGQIVKDCRP